MGAPWCSAAGLRWTPVLAVLIGFLGEATSIATLAPAAGRVGTTAVSVDNDGRTRRDLYRLGSISAMLSASGRHVAFTSYADLVACRHQSRTRRLPP